MGDHWGSLYNVNCQESNDTWCCETTGKTDDGHNVSPTITLLDSGFIKVPSPTIAPQMIDSGRHSDRSFFALCLVPPGRNKTNWSLLCQWQSFPNTREDTHRLRPSLTKSSATTSSSLSVKRLAPRALLIGKEYETVTSIQQWLGKRASFTTACTRLTTPLACSDTV